MSRTGTAVGGPDGPAGAAGVAASAPRGRGSRGGGAGVPFDRGAIERYVLGRRTPDGGYCFYRVPEWGVEEPNAPDTLAALETLRLLGIPAPEPETTVRFLRSLQGGDGSYPTLTIGWAALRALDVLAAEPVRPPATWLRSLQPMLLARTGARAWRGALREALRLVEALSLTDSGPGIDGRGRAQCAELLAAARDPRGGWARPDADLETTGAAGRLVVACGLDPTGLDGGGGLLRRCEDPVLGLRLAPGGRATSVGALWGGLVVAGAAGVRLRFPAAVSGSLVQLQRPDGGLGPRHRAISTLADTWRGVEAAALFDQIEERAR